MQYWRGSKHTSSHTSSHTNILRRWWRSCRWFWSQFYKCIKINTAFLWFLNHCSFGSLSRTDSFSGVSLSVWGACQLPPPRRQPAYTHVQQRWGAFAVCHPSESPWVSQSPRPGYSNHQSAPWQIYHNAQICSYHFSQSFFILQLFASRAISHPLCFCHCRRGAGMMLMENSLM